MIKEHLIGRHMDVSLYPTSAIVSEYDDTVTFMLYDFNNILCGYQKYNPNGVKVLRRSEDSGRYFTHTTKGHMGVWGMEYESELYPDVLIIVEGVFKACRFHTNGLNACATLTNNPVFAKETFKNLPYRTIVVSDTDSAGMKLIKYGKYSITPPKPVDDLTEEEFDVLLEDIHKIIEETT